MSKRMCALVGMVVAVATLLVASANAAVSINLVVASEPIDPAPGSTIVLETYVTANAGELDNTIFGAINYNDAILDSNVAGNSQTPLFSSQGALTCTTSFCVVFSQVNLNTVPTGEAGSMVKVVRAIRKFVRLTAMGPAGLTWLNTTQNAVVQVRAP